MNSHDPHAVMLGLLIGWAVGTVVGVGLFCLGLNLWHRWKDRRISG